MPIVVLFELSKIKKFRPRVRAGAIVARMRARLPGRVRPAEGIR